MNKHQMNKRQKELVRFAVQHVLCNLDEDVENHLESRIGLHDNLTVEKELENLLENISNNDDIPADLIPFKGEQLLVVRVPL